MEPKPLASLSAGLLARKGGARPAMRRPQLGNFINPSLPSSVQEDLGWNDMGEEEAIAPAPLKMVTPETSSAAQTAPVPSAPAPAVVRQQENLAEQLGSEAAAEVAPATADKPKASKTSPKVRQRKSKAAFTLRLDPQRHLRLRLACAVNNRSAQQIVTDALDAFLDNQPELERLVDQVSAKAGAKPVK
ncbi:MAG: hypothetical protein R3E11_13415 [Sphingobium sp.]|jgi:hypothetical protein|nr:hypothetical protein [Sphingobium sp.]MCP5399398.1 hypothetical protein [Sphingomonas sp.]